jgi:O-succinylbenzoate synthase
MTGPVERITLTHLQVPLKEPIRVGAREVLVKDAILVAVESSEGVGLGECSPPAPGVLGDCGPFEQCWTELSERIAPRLLGQGVASADEIGRLASGWTASPCAVAGVETACWDLLAQTRHVTLAEMLGASSDQLGLKVESGLAVGLYPTIVELLKAIETHLAESYRRVKVDIEPGRDIELVRAVRQHFGDIPLMVDAGGRYTTDDLDVFRELDAFDLLMIEQPMAAGDLAGSAALQAEIVTPVCLDESASSPERIAEAIGQGAGRIVTLKVQRLGGLGPALRAHDECHRQGVACWVGTTPELGIGQAHGIHLAALGNCRYPADLGPSARWFVDDYVVPRIELAAPGLLNVPARSGLGYLVDSAKVKRYQVRQHEVTAKAAR